MLDGHACDMCPRESLLRDVRILRRDPAASKTVGGDMYFSILRDGLSKIDASGTASKALHGITPSTTFFFCLYRYKDMVNLPRGGVLSPQNHRRCSLTAPA